ncbi:MAG TPA: plasmid pRiA4b ORF-3 family protein [Syntrophales bacterium]|nr:plasmid pRiA4b ORF-3 family protein [Syntrophales bacterium]
MRESQSAEDKKDNNNLGYADELIKSKIRAFLRNPLNPRAEYAYDFGDGWVHVILLEGILDRQKGVDYPLCIGGERACPPEDCGGSYGYEEFLSIIMNPGHEEHESRLEWAGGEFHPEHFDCSEVVFEDPDERLQNLDADF